MIDDFLGKKYKLTKNENYDTLMDALTVNLAMAKCLQIDRPVVELQKKDDSYVFTSKSSLKNITFEFKDGVEFNQETLDGRNVKSTITIDGNVLNEVQKDADVGDIIIKRTFSDSGLITEVKYDDINCCRTYKIQE